MSISPPNAARINSVMQTGGADLCKIAYIINTNNPMTANGPCVNVSPLGVFIFFNIYESNSILRMAANRKKCCDN